MRKKEKNQASQKAIGCKSEEYKVSEKEREIERAREIEKGREKGRDAKFSSVETKSSPVSFSLVYLLFLGLSCKSLLTELEWRE